ncbi:MAG: sensor histidine kinase [Bacteroides cellulosilyticus]|nr:sensor histidine kinase [Bacteroides cellulosilyticus]
MKKSYYILLTITATAAVLYLLGNWVGRSFGLNRQQVIRNIHEAYGRATDAFEAGQTKDLAAFFRNELDEVNLKRIKFRLDTVSLHGDSIVLKQDLRYFSDYRKLLEQHYTFVCPVNDAQGVHAYIQNLRAGFIGKLLYMFFGTIAALGLLLFAIRKQVDIIRRQDELARMREDFSSAMVHDMKNPISSILIGLKVLRSGKVDSKPEKKQKHFDILEAEAQHLLALANKVLTISKLEHGQLLLDKNWIQLRPMVDELVHTFTAKAEKPITFQVDLQEEGAYADEEYLKEALSNLIDNAIKYSPDKADIMICCRKKETEQVEISVTDHGIGIPTDKQPHIFDKFYRVPTGNIHNTKGYGLGLFYVKTMVEKHGGIVTVRSEAGKGSTFTIRI